MRTVDVRGRDTDRPRNPYYEQDIILVLKHPRWILRSIGIWPSFLENDSRIFPILLIGLCNLIMFFSVVPFYLYITIEEEDITMKLKLIGLLSFCVVSLMKYWTLAACKPRLKDCLESLENDWKEVEHQEDRQLMLKYGNAGRSVILLCLVFMYSGGFMYHTIVQFAAGSYVDEQNRTIKPLSYPVYSALYNPQRSPVYEIVFATHVVCGYLIYSVALGVCGLATTFASHVCGQIDVMMLRLEHLVELENKTELDQRLIQIVEHHIRTLRFSATVETLLQEVCLMEFIGSTFLICLLEYYILMDWGTNTLTFVTYFTLLVSLLFNVFILCYVGDLLIEKTSNVGLSCFMMDWYKFPTDTIRAIILIITMSSSPAKISAGQIAVLDLSTFGNVVKTSLAYLSLLRTVV